MVTQGCVAERGYSLRSFFTVCASGVIMTVQFVLKMTIPGRAPAGFLIFLRSV